MSTLYFATQKSEEDFVAKGYGVKRYQVMYNDFVVVGPAKPLNATKDRKKMFTDINNDNLTFVSEVMILAQIRLKAIWSSLKIDPK